MLRHGPRTSLSCLVAIVLGLLAVNCGGGSDEKGTQLPKAEETGELGDFAVYKVEAAGFSIGIPRSWRALTSDEIDESQVEAFAEQNPGMRPTIDAMFNDPDSPLKLLAIDPEITKNYATNLSVTVRPALPGDTVEGLDSAEQTEAFKRQISEFLRGPVENVSVALPAGKANKLAYQVEVKDPAGNSLLLAQEQYTLIASDRQYSLIFTALAEREREYENTFIQSARSFQFAE